MSSFEIFFPNIRRYMSLPASEQAKVPTPKPGCSICLSSVLKCYPLNNYGTLVTECPETGEDLERMVVLYCGHVVGHDCMKDYLATCYSNYTHPHGKSSENLPRCPVCRETLTSDCHRPFAKESSKYVFVTPFVIAPLGPPVEGREDGPGERYEPENPIDFRVMDEAILSPISFTFNNWKNIPYTRPEGGILPRSCRVCEEDIYDDAVRRYQTQRSRFLARRQRQRERAEATEQARQQAAAEGTQGRRNVIKESSRSMAFKSVQLPRESIYDETPARPRQLLWPLGYCVLAVLPIEDGTLKWIQLRVRVATRTMYNAVLDDGLTVHIPLEPRCFGPPELGPMRFGRHPVASRRDPEDPDDLDPLHPQHPPTPPPEEDPNSWF